MSAVLTFTVIGLVIGAAYAIASTGLVITYATSSVFNMAHGAVGMVMAYLYWELQVNQGLPVPLALLLVVGVIAPLFGVILERTMMRQLVGASVTVTLTVTVGLLVLLLGVAQTFWPPAARTVQPFFPGTTVQAAGVIVSGHQILTFVLALLVAIGLYLLLNRTRTGTAMRALVDDRGLLALHGARPQLLASLSWAIGSALAALAGILLVSELGLDYLTLTLLVVNAYAAAMVGRLVSLPRTFVGAVILGLLQAYFLLGMRYVPTGTGEALTGMLTGLRAALPTLFLFATMLLLPQEKLRVGSVAGAAMTRVPSRASAVRWGLGLVAAVVLVTGVLSSAQTAALSTGLMLGLVMLSLVLLTGYGGDVSLSQMTFVGVGALVIARVFGEIGPVAILAASLAAAAVGVLVALPALRLRGLYLGLGTLAFAVAMDKLVFESNVLGFQLGGSIVIQRPTVLGISLESERAFAIATAVAFVGMAWGLLALRRGRFGRMLLATRDSPAACSTLGMSVTRTRVVVFAISAGMAGFAGAFFAGVNIAVGATDFQMFQSLPLLLLAVVGGITSVTGALLGGLLLGLGPAITDLVPALGNALNVLIGAAAIALGRNPNGLAGIAFRLGARFRGTPEDQVASGEPAVATDSDEIPEEVSIVAAP
jgi:branched-chain amino acid transport system permease protein